MITATATDPGGNTSEFSAAAALQPLAVLAVDAGGVLTYTASAGVANTLALARAGGTYSFHDDGERIFVMPGSAGCLGSGTDMVSCAGAGLKAVHVDVGDRDDTVVLQAPGTTPVSLGGGAGANTLQGPDGSNTWQLTGADAGTLGGVFFVSFGNLRGGSAADAFVLHTGTSLSGSIDGQGGSDTLDYSARAGDIVADLALGTATGVGGAVSNVENITGGSGNAILVGDAGANVLRGGTGRSLIIGEAAADQLFGGGGDNILIGGTTSYDLNLAALQAIMNELRQTYDPTNAVNDFNIRANNIRDGKGTLSGAGIYLDKRSGKHAATVFGDGAADVFTAGGGLNWYFEDASDPAILDQTKNQKKNDRVTQV